MTPFIKKTSQTLMTAAVLAALISCTGQDKAAHAQASPSFSSNITNISSAPLVTGLPDFTQLVDHVAPAVVSIRTTEKVQPRAMSRGQDPICAFFPDFPPCQMQEQQPRAPQAAPQERTRGMGSGFIISNDGYILTNNHVVAGASTIIVTLTDKREFKAKVIGRDERTDVALIKIEGSNFPTLKTTNSDNIKVGQWVMAAGSPFGLKNSVTAGIVSAINRDTGDYVSFIQTDAAVNPGNSGGPLVNMSGEVVGINSQILSTNGAFAGVALAIPINDALKVADQLKASGKIERGRIGVQIADIDEQQMATLGLNSKEGALVTEVEARSAAAKAGIIPGDVVLKIDNTPIKNGRDLAHRIGEAKPGTTFVVEIWRDKAVKRTEVIAEAAQANPARPQ